jgi:NADH:ubiquinone oxidoreductase subunit E
MAMEVENSIVVCMGSSCFARGNRRNLEVVEQFLAAHGLKAEVRLAGSRCDDDCQKGPNVIINGVAHHGVDTGALIDLLNAEFIACRKK